MPCRSINDEAELYKSKKFKADSAWLIVFKANDSFHRNPPRFFNVTLAILSQRRIDAARSEGDSERTFDEIYQFYLMASLNTPRFLRHQQADFRHFSSF